MRTFLALLGTAIGVAAGITIALLAYALSHHDARVSCGTFGGFFSACPGFPDRTPFVVPGALIGGLLGAYAFITGGRNL